MIIMVFIKRLFAAIPTLIGLTLVLFLMVKAIPGDPAQMLLGDKANKESLEQLREEMGLNQPLLMQYGIYLQQLVVHQNLGESLVTKQPVWSIIKEKFPATVELSVCAMIIAGIFGIGLGIIAAIKPGSFLDFSAMGVAVVGVSLPVFWLGLMLMLIFGFIFEIFPLSGRISIDFMYEPVTGFLLWDSLVMHQDIPMFLEGLKHIVLPAVTLGTIPMAFLARMTRTSMIEVLRQDYMRTAKAKGCGFFKMMMKHALRNASIPITTILGLQFGTLLAGAMITETLFAWPGMGGWILESVAARDIPALEGGVMVVAFSFVVINLLVDCVYQIMDPRVRVS